MDQSDRDEKDTELRKHKQIDDSDVAAGPSGLQIEITIDTDSETVKEKRFECRFCDFNRKAEKDVLCHEMIKHNQENLSNHYKDKAHKCIHCPYSSLSPSILKMHEQTHATKKRARKEHIQSSDINPLETADKDEKPFKCSYCSYETARPNNLKIHERTHTGEKPFKCSYCSYECAQSNVLKHHERTHTGEKPYKCNYCSYKCARAHSLKAHERTHTGEKPFKCSYCSYECAHSTDLKPHERTHTGEKPFKCSYCSYACSRSKYLKLHERIHTGEKPFKCSYCSYECAKSCNLKSHERTHTGKKSI